MECNNGKSCPYLNGGDVFALFMERKSLRERIIHMEGVMGLVEAEIKALKEENQKLKEENGDLLHRVKKMVRKIFKPGIKREGDGETSKRGAPYGHHGKGRIRPEEVHEHVDVYPDKCVCGSTDIEGYENSFDEHIVEDIEVRKKVKCYRMHYGRCRRCKKVVSPQRDESIIKNGRIGPMARAVGSYLRYMGIPYRKVARIFKDVFHLKISHASLMHYDTRQAENGVRLYEGVKEVIRSSASVNVDETGWRMDGENCWLWVFVTNEAVLYMIAKSRGSKVVIKVLGLRYGGILGSDFYSAYNPIEAQGKQKCLAHLLGDIKDIENKNKNKFPLESADGRFCNGLKETLKEGTANWNEYKKGNKGIEELKEDRDRIISKMIELIQIPVENPDLQRIHDRIIKYNDELFTFLYNPIIEPTNNIAERNLRPNVIMRKITFGNRSEGGAEKHQIIMSIIQTGILNKVEPLDIFLALTRGEVSSFEGMVRIRGP